MHGPGKRGLQDIPPLTLVGLVDLSPLDPDVASGQEGLPRTPVGHGQDDDNLPDILQARISIEGIEPERLHDRREHHVWPVGHDGVAVLAHFDAERVLHDLGDGPARDEVPAAPRPAPDARGLDPAIDDLADLHPPRGC